MVRAREPDTDELLRQADADDPAATQVLLARHRSRLRRMVAVHLDRRLQGRVDPSDIVQEALVDAARKLPRYLRERPLPFYPWLRELAWERLARARRRHLRAARRSVAREDRRAFHLTQDSAAHLARLLVASGTPSEQAVQQERLALVRETVRRLRPRDAEILVLRYLEQLEVEEIAAVLGLTVPGVKSRVRRALERFAEIWRQESSGE